MISVKKARSIDNSKNAVFLVHDHKSPLDDAGLSKEEKEHVVKELSDEKCKQVFLQRLKQWICFVKVDQKKEVHKILESARKSGAEILLVANKNKTTELQVIDLIHHASYTMAFVEGLMLASYQFLKYKKDAKKIKSH